MYLYMYVCYDDQAYASMYVCKFVCLYVCMYDMYVCMYACIKEVIHTCTQKREEKMKS